MKPSRVIYAALTALLLAACALPGGSDALVRVYDLGLTEPAARPIGARIGQVRVTAPLNSTDMHYRLAYRDAAELMSFSQSRWAATPAELVRKRFVRSVEAAAGARCTLDIEVNEFSQVFSARDTSEALVELRLVLADAGGRIAEHTVRVNLPGAGADAAQGVAVMARATDESISRSAAWVGQQGACKAR
jgi:cholesterol transport system auxiliary component